MERLPISLEPDSIPRSLSYSMYDIIISLPHDVVEDILKHDVSALVRAWPYFPPIPCRTKRVWIYQRSTKTIVYIIRLDYHCHHHTLDHSSVLHLFTMPSTSCFQILRYLLQSHFILSSMDHVHSPVIL